MAVTQKISVAMGLPELRLAKTAAEEEGLSLSAYVTQAVRRQLEERARREAARAILGTFSPDELATPEEQQKLLALWNRTPTPRRRPTKPRARKHRS